MSNLRYEQMTYELRGLIFDVRAMLKAGWPEEVYHQGLVRLSNSRRIPVLYKPRKTIFHRGIEVHLFECDLIAWDTIILELKVIPYATFAAAHYAQIIHYLKCWNMGLGLLVNFGHTQAEIKRVIWDEPEVTSFENYEAITSKLAGADWACLKQIKESLLTVGQQYGLGYPESMYRKIAAIEANHDGLQCQEAVEIPARIGDAVLGSHVSDHLLIEGKFLLSIRALLDQLPVYEFARMKTYLNSLGLSLGLVVNFGKKQLQIYGVNPD